jgi:soluble lytic murein transglycosylase-like protein
MRDARGSVGGLGHALCSVALLSSILAPGALATDVPEEPAPIANPWLASRPASETTTASAVQITRAGDGWRLRYRIARGDTLGRIAQRLGVSLRALVDTNHIRDPRRIVAGRWLHVPSVLDEEGDAQITRVPEELETHPHRLGLLLSIQRWAREYDLDPDLLAALAWVESRWQSNALSEKQAMGIGQLVPETVAFACEVLLRRQLDPWNPEHNLQMSARFLRYLLDETRGQLDDALAAYYQGLGALRRDGWYPVTKPYVERVRAARALFT